jgi:hypothetical protein
MDAGLTKQSASSETRSKDTSDVVAETQLMDLGAEAPVAISI